MNTTKRKELIPEAWHTALTDAGWRLVKIDGHSYYTHPRLAWRWPPGDAIRLQRDEKAKDLLETKT